MGLDFHEIDYGDSAMDLFHVRRYIAKVDNM
jgi:hypothetical protein